MAMVTSTRPTPDRRLSGLVASIQADDCVLVLGPRIAAPVEVAGPDVSLSDDLAGKLIEDLDGQLEAPMGLRRSISRYERERSPQACRTLVQQLISEYEGHPTPLHLDLAALPFRLVLSATHDSLMLDAFRRVGKDGATGAYYDHQRGPAGIAPLALPTVQRPIVYSLLGRYDHPESMVLNEMNLLDYLVSLTKEKPPLPDAVRATLRARSTVFLFIGFGFENWWLRLLLKVLQITGVENRGVSLALEESRAFEDRSLDESKDFFVSAGIYIQPGDWNALAKDLRARVVLSRTSEVPSANPSGGQFASPRSVPKVFLSYASEDMELVNAIREGLTARGLDVWQDKTNLRAGQYWEDEIERIIGGVNFFVFVQTEQMDRRDRMDDKLGGVYNRELKLALFLLKDKLPGTPFVIHLTVGNCVPRPEKELNAIHRIAFDDACVEILAEDMLATFSGAGSS